MPELPTREARQRYPWVQGALPWARMQWRRQATALTLALMLVGPAMALTQTRLYQGGGDPSGEGFVAIQQHAVFVELIAKEFRQDRRIVKFAAVVGLVKECKQVRNVFDNAVLWFNDQFLFGNKSNVTFNVTPPDAMGRNPNRTLSDDDLLDPNRNNGTGRYNPATGGEEVDQVGTGPNEGGNPDRDGFIRARDKQERWGGCFIPNGFIHGIRTASGLSGLLGSEAERMDQARRVIDLDNECDGCLIRYDGTFYVTDPNNHRWMVDRLTYPTGGFGPTRETLYTVHVQVDPWNPDRQGFPDEAVWAYREDGTLRVGMPYAEDDQAPMYDFCKDNSIVTDQALEYDLQEVEGGPWGPPPPASPAPSPDPAVNATDWTTYRRGPVGTTVECSIEYNFLLAISLGDFGSAGRVDHGDGAADDTDKAWQGNSHPHAPKECYWVDEDGNRTGPWGDPRNHTVCDPLPAGNATHAGPQHRHDAVELNLFFYHRAPHFVEQNPYWDHANGTDTLTTTGTPPIVTDDCMDARNLPPNDYRAQAVQARDPIVCDVDAVDGFHFHDRSQTMP